MGCVEKGGRLMAVEVYGIPNCDTVKKARVWLDAQGIAYVFHDYKKEGADAGKLAAWIDAAGLDKVLNRAGTTFRKLPDADKADLDTAKAVALMVANPSTIKRPVVEHPGGVLVGFKEPEWAAALG
jgi:Spx/MgsR family transcriptional regulator